jgi:phosphatidylserine/phosphatidylglycerophosphate/cardiolipin synthase-like enzyme
MIMGKVLTRNDATLGTSTFVSGSHREKLKAVVAKGPILAAVAYVSDTDGLSLSKGDLLICDASEKSALAGATRRDALQKFFSKGVRIWSVPYLHAKVVIAGDTAIVGSANWSANSEANLIEASICSRDPKVVAAATAFVNGLAKYPACRVNQKFLNDMPEPVVQEGGDGRGREEGRCWLISLHPLTLTRRNRAASEEIDAMAAQLQQNVKVLSSRSYARRPIESPDRWRSATGL